ncbi:PAS domain S-box protein [Arenibacter sp. F26102]|uniref:PAS domain S-box protein n=1 Tax=Arenibacter sp. F26102 TaxID=2926416 RepID=UPI001FF12527|nr:PAS domain S-box protein [Arenibacter sp. F26102]
MFRKRIELFPTFPKMEVPLWNYNDICQLASFVIDSPSIKIEILKLPIGLENEFNGEHFLSQIEKQVLDHLDMSPNELLNLKGIEFDELIDSSANLDKAPPLNLIIAPLVDSDKTTLGIVCFHTQETLTLSKQQTELIKALANQAVPFIPLQKEKIKTLSPNAFFDNININLSNYSEVNGTASWEFDIATNNLWLSPLFFDMLGYKPDELKLESIANWVDLVFFLDQDKLRNIWQKWSNNDFTQNEFECRVVHESGDLVFINIEVNNSKINDDNELIFFEGDIQDITTQKKVWQQIELINPKFTSVIQAGYNWMAVVDLNGNYSYANSTLKSAVGYTTEELMDKNFFSFVHDGERDKVANYFSKFLINEPFVSKPFRYRHKSGTWKWIEILLINLKDDPMIQGVVVNARDITERVLTNKKIKASEEKHRLLFNSSPYPKYILETESLRILDVNEAMLKFYGYSREEYTTMTALDLRPQEEVNKLLEGIREFQLQDKTLNSGIYVHKKKNGELVKMEIVGQHVTINGVKCILVNCTDVTDKEQYLEELKQSEQKLKRASVIAKLGYWNFDDLTLSFSEEVYKIWERKQDSNEFNYDSFLDTIHPDDREAFIDQNKRSIAQNENYDFVYRIVLPNNSVKWIHQLGQPVQGTDLGTKKFEGTLQDITQRKKEEQHLRLLESVVTNTKDAVLITEAEPFDRPGPGILYVNDAFTEMTGYTPEDVIGKTPRILQGPRSDKAELKRLSRAMRRWEPCEITVVNYKKNGEEFWVNMSLTPVADEKGWFTHWISIERDVSEQKNQELLKNLIIDISVLFSYEKDLKSCLLSVLSYLADFGDYALGEIWLPNSENTQLKLFVNDLNRNTENWSSKGEQSDTIFEYTEGLAYSVWKMEVMEIWDTEELKGIEISGILKDSGVSSLVGIPLVHNENFFGVLNLGLDAKSKHQILQGERYQEISNHLAAEIKRKLLENELDHIFSFAPDILCKAGYDGYFKKINPATSKLLGYSEEELLSKQIIEFVHPEDREKTRNQQMFLYEGNSYKYFENRYITKKGDIIWLSWTARPIPEEDAIYAVAKDITENRELKNILNEVTDLALIGAWELNLKRGHIYWSEMTKKIHEVDVSFSPTIESVLGYCQSPETREIVLFNIENALKRGKSWDMELEIITAKGNQRWVRMIGKPDFINDECVRIFGSFQDINDLKTSQIEVESANNEKNSILESIGDAFISVDDGWVVTYWNKMAEELFGVQKANIIGNNIWKVFENIVDPKVFVKHYKDLKKEEAANFQEYFSEWNKWLEISVYHSENAYSLYVRDITEKLQSQIAVEQQNEKLREIAWTQSHVVRAPLARLMGIIDLLNENTVDENEKNLLLDHVYSSAVELDTIIQEIVHKSQAVIANQKP